jgi:hypothetical protein
MNPILPKITVALKGSRAIRDVFQAEENFLTP